MSEERQVIAGVGQEHQFEVAVDIRAVGVSGAVLVVVALRMSQAQMCAPTYCNTDTFFTSHDGNLLLQVQVSVVEWLAHPTAVWRTQVRITPLTVVFIATAAAIYSLEHGLCTFTAVLRSTQPSTPRGTVKRVSAYGLSNNNNGDGGCGR